MPDISMCDNRSCKKFADCYRAQATPSKYHQAYSTFGSEGCDGCEDFKVIYDRTQKTLAEKDDLDLLCDAINGFMAINEKKKKKKSSMSQEISIRPILPEYRCFKLKDVSEESLNKLIGWAKDKLDIDIEVSLTTDNKLYRSKSQNQVVATHATTQLRLRHSVSEGDYDHRSEIVVEDNKPIYCVYARSYLFFHSYSDFHKEFVEEVN